MSSLLDDKPIPRDELLELLPDAWPGLGKALQALERVDSISVAVVRRLLREARRELVAQDRAAMRETLLELLAGAVVPVERFETRERELLAANSREVERGREARAFVRKVATLTDTEVDFEGLREIRDEARRVSGEWGGPVTWRPRYNENERDRAASLLAIGSRNGHSSAELVDLVAEALGMARA